MQNELFLYIMVVMIAGILSSFLCLYAQNRLKNAPGAKPYMLVTLFSSIFTFAYAFELSGKSIEQKTFWLNIEYLAMPFIPVFILLMCLEYVGQRLKQWMYYGLFVIPTITIFMHETNPLHHLYYTSIELNEDSPFPILKLDHGPLFYLHSIYLFLCLMISMIALLRQLKKIKLFRFRMQIFLMVAGIVLPIITNYYYINGLSQYGIDLGPVSMSLSFIFHGAALLSYQMFNVTPIARDTVFESMKDGVIVLNQSKRIVDYNQSILKIVPKLNSHIIGKLIDDVVVGNKQLEEIISFEKECDYELCLDGENTHYHIRFSTVRSKRNYEIGKIITFVDVSERVALQEKLKKLASIDGLTQLYNRSFFIKEAERIIDDIKTNGEYISIIMFDIDHFKNINDTFGHEAGDLVLAHIAGVAKDSLRTNDIIGRYGGEEFIICMPDTALTEAHELAESIRVKISQTIMHYDDHEISVTSSLGISSTVISKGSTLKSLMREADQALYYAKNKGRNNVEIYRGQGDRFVVPS